jgi:hypothetical protein
MKLISLFVSIILISMFSAASFAQRQPQLPFVNETNGKPLTDLEEFQDIYGTTLIKGFTDLPRIRANLGFLQLTIVEFRSTASNTRVKGVLAEVTTGDKLNEKARSFIEYAELEGLIKGVTYISKIDKGASQLQNLEAVFTTKGEFSISNFFNWQGEPRIGITVGRYDKKTVFIDSTSQGTVLGQLQQAKTTLDEW